MPHYYSLGTVPHKRHTQFTGKTDRFIQSSYSPRKGSRVTIPYSIIVIRRRRSLQRMTLMTFNLGLPRRKMLKHRSFDGFKVLPHEDYLRSRRAVLVNSDCHIVLAAPQRSMQDYFYKNADADEISSSIMAKECWKTIYGEFPFSYGDYLSYPGVRFTGLVRR